MDCNDDHREVSVGDGCYEHREEFENDGFYDDISIYFWKSENQKYISEFLVYIVDVLKKKFNIGPNSFEMKFGQVVIVDIKKVVKYFDPSLNYYYEFKYYFDYVFKKDLSWFENCVLLYIQLTFANTDYRLDGLQKDIDERMNGWIIKQRCDEYINKLHFERQLVKMKGITFDNLD